MEDHNPIKLKIEKLRDQFPGSSNKVDLDKFENTANELLKNKEVVDSIQFKKFCKDAEKQINGFSTLLMNDDSLLNEEGKRIYDQREFWRTMVKFMGIKSTDDALQALESMIDSKLKEE